jgi:uncharacterized protein
MPSDDFDWDDDKSEINRERHGVTFEEAQTVFGDRRATTIYDEAHSQSEDRWITIGLSEGGRLLVVVHTDETNVIRIISARQATRREARQYADANPGS